MPNSGFVVVYGGSFSSANGQPYAGASLYAKPSTQAVAAGQLSDQEFLLGVLDSQGNLPQSANAQLWANDAVIPSGTAYFLRLVSSDGSPVFGPTAFYISGSSPLNLGDFVPSSLNVQYLSPIVQNPNGDQTILEDDLLPAPGNTTQSLGSAAAPWNATLNNLTIAGSTTFGVVNALTGFQIGGAAPATHVLRGNGVDYVDAVLAASDLSNGVTGTGAVVLAAAPQISSLSMTGLITKYNNLATVGVGIPSEVATVGLVTQAASIGSTTLWANATGAAQLVRVIWDIICTKTGSSGNTVTATFGWNNGAASPTAVTSAASLTVLGAELSGVLIASVTNSTNLTYLTTVNNTTGAPQYSLNLRVEII